MSILDRKPKTIGRHRKPKQSVWHNIQPKVLGLGAAALMLPVATPMAVYVATYFAVDTKADGGWAGYVAQGDGFRDVSGSWTIPRVQCDKNGDIVAPWIGLDGWGSKTVEQTGVAISCERGRSQAMGWYEMFPQAPVYYNDPIAPGDVMSAQVTTDGSGDYELTLKDNTKGWSESVSRHLNAQHVSAEAVIESQPHRGMPAFDAIAFTDVSVDGQPIETANLTTTSLTDADGVLHTPGPLSNGSFAISHSSPAGGPSVPARPARPLTAPPHQGLDNRTDGWHGWWTPASPQPQHPVGRHSTDTWSGWWGT